MKLTFNLRHVGGVAIATTVLACSSNPNDAGYTQIERLARPAINEGTVATNDNLNAFNSIPPSLDLSANPAVVAVRTEVVNTLNVFDSLETANAGDPTAADDNMANRVASGFLPDVMRIDTSTTVAANGVAYIACAADSENNADLANDFILCGGRKIEDDVVDITLNYLVLGDPAATTLSDFIAYADNHKAVLAGFPYLAQPW